MSTHQKTLPIDVLETLDSIRELHNVGRRRRYYRSRLDRYRSELVELRKNGASWNELVTFLRLHRIKVARSTVIRYVNKLPEINNGKE